VGNDLVGMYTKCGIIDEEKHVFEEIRVRGNWLKE
jgi:hypothetical protein